MAVRATIGKHDPGRVVILFDNRHCGPLRDQDKMGYVQSYWLGGLYRMGWPTYWQTPDLDPGMIRLVWYTVRLPLFYPSGKDNVPLFPVPCAQEPETTPSPIALPLMYPAD